MNLYKCKLNANELVYLGHKISAKGVEPHDAKVKAIMKMLEPTDKKAVKRILGQGCTLTLGMRGLLQKDVH